MKFKLSFRLIVTLASIIMAILFGLVRIADPEVVQVLRLKYFDVLQKKYPRVTDGQTYSVIVDIDWRGYYVGRKDHPISEAENVIFNSNNEVQKIGKINTGSEEVHGEFIGMIKLSNRGTEIFKEHFHRLKKIYWNRPFQRASTFQKAYLTDFIQEIVDIGIKVHCVIIESGWKEIDTVEDYKKALIGFNKKFIKS